MTTYSHSLIICEDSNALTTEELLQLLSLDWLIIDQFIQEDIIKPQGTSKQTYRFDSRCITRLQKAQALIDEWEINPEGMSYVFGLLDKIEALEKKYKHE